MNPVVKNILAVIVGLLLGGLVNFAIIMVSGLIIAPPEGVNPGDMESIKAAMEAGLYEAHHFILPFLAHAIGTLIGALLAARIAASHKMVFAIVVGAFFLIGGITNVLMLPSPMWFNVLDIVAAYIPMAFIGGKLGGAGKETA